MKALFRVADLYEPPRRHGGLRLGPNRSRRSRMPFMSVVAPIVLGLSVTSIYGQHSGASGAATFDAICAECHDSAASGAPRIGDRAAWKNRSRKGMAVLAEYALGGTCGTPPQGGYVNATDVEVRRAIAYMANRSGGNLIEPDATGGSDGPRSGMRIVQAQCAMCHAAGVSGAPRIGDRAAWNKRLVFGIEKAVQSAIRGNHGMPPRGGAGSLAEPEIRSAIVYMASRKEPLSPDPRANGQTAVRTRRP